SIYAKNAGKIKSHVIPNMADEPDYFERLIKSAKAHMLKGQIENTEKIDWFESIKKEIEKLPEPNYAELLKNLPKHYQKELRTNKKLQEDVKTLIEINKIPVDEHFPAKFEDCSGVAQMDEYLTINKGKKGMLKSAKAFLAENEMTIHKTFGVIWQKNEEYYNDLELLVSEENYEGIAGFVDDETDEFRKEIEYKLKRFAGIDEVDGVYYAEN
ncbi:MAG: hypothetical protein U9R19_08265, partial [Bacteroidota bacterium]|nr:hypothetical protein [Bacteroidota bacterium]